jgi:hypothetical protein
MRLPVRSVVVLLLALVVAVTALRGRARRGAVGIGERERTAVPAPVADPSASASSAPAAPPSPEEVRAAVDRAFGRALALDRTAAPPFLAGDFNGDGITDLAVAVRPRDGRGVAALDAPEAAWHAQDMAVPPLPTAGRPGSVLFALDDLLLAVLHGSGAAAWRGADASDAYLLRHALGAGLRARRLADAPPAIQARAARPAVGHVLASTRAGAEGALVWTGTAYAWVETGS